MSSLETLEQLIHDNEKLTTMQHEHILDRIDRLEKKFDEKIVILDKGNYEFQAWKNYIVGVVTIVSIMVSLGFQYLFT